METVNGKGQILDGHIFIYPADEEELDKVIDAAIDRVLAQKAS